MTRFILHVGPHKTGTTYIQNSLTRYRHRLLEYGVYYPTEWLTVNTWCHVGLADALRRKDTGAVSGPLSTIMKRRPDAVVISCEDLSSLRSDELQLLKDQLAALGSIEIVYYVRRWSELLKSAAQEHVRQGGIQIFPEFCVHRMLAPFASDTINFLHGLDKFSNVFGKEFLKLASYNNIIEDGNDLFLHFLKHFLDISPPRDVAVLEPAHVSLPIVDLEILRMMNVFRSEDKAEQATDQDGAWVQTISQAELPLVRKAMNQFVEKIKINEKVKPFSDIYSNVIGSYRGNIVSSERTDNENLLFERRASAIEYVGSGYLTRPGIVEELRKFFSDLTVNSERPKEKGAANSQPSSPAMAPDIVFALEFGRHGNAASHLGSGWSAGEAGFTWMIGLTSEIWLENAGAESDYNLELEATGFVAPPSLESQRLIVSARGVQLGQALVSGRRCTLKFKLPREVLSEPGPVQVVFSHPDAAKPLEFGQPRDKRLLAVAVRKLRLIRLAGQSRGATSSNSRSGP